MNCNIIKDLLPLYIDDCCSEETRELVKEHLDSCAECNAMYLEMSSSTVLETSVSTPNHMKRVNDWRASILQSLLFFILFGAITLGVALEASTDYNQLTNGYFAFNIVLPATGFMLSLANWHFVRLYRSKKVFSRSSMLLTLAITFAAHIWCMGHYEIGLSNFLSFFESNNMAEGLFSLAQATAFAFGCEIFLTVVFAIFSKTLSDKYAELLGKE
jgi:hypothetical protein